MGHNHHSVHHNHSNNHHNHDLLHLHHHSSSRLEAHLHHSVRPCIRKALRVPVHLAGQDLTSCTKEGDDQGKLWCSTMVDQAGNHVAGQGQYGFCSQTCNQGLRRVKNKTE